jgi:hypothetical protein
MRATAVPEITNYEVTMTSNMDGKGRVQFKYTNGLSIWAKLVEKGGYRNFEDITATAPAESLKQRYVILCMFSPEKRESMILCADTENQETFWLKLPSFGVNYKKAEHSCLDDNNNHLVCLTAQNGVIETYIINFTTKTVLSCKENLIPERLLIPSPYQELLQMEKIGSLLILYKSTDKICKQILDIIDLSHNCGAKLTCHSGHAYLSFPKMVVRIEFEKLFGSIASKGECWMCPVE